MNESEFLAKLIILFIFYENRVSKIEKYKNNWVPIYIWEQMNLIKKMKIYKIARVNRYLKIFRPETCSETFYRKSAKYTSNFYDNNKIFLPLNERYRCEDKENVVFSGKNKFPAKYLDLSDKHIPTWNKQPPVLSYSSMEIMNFSGFFFSSMKVKKLL